MPQAQGMPAQGSLWADSEVLIWTSTFYLVCYDILSKKRVQLRSVNVYSMFACFALCCAPGLLHVLSLKK